MAVEERRRGVPGSDEAAILRMARSTREFLATEAAGGAVMLLGVVVALVWVNGPFGDSYHDLVDHHLRLHVGFVDIDRSVHGWINEGLMTVFFFVVGLEIKRELVTGELRDPRAAALPVIAAVGGMIVPAMVFVLLNGTGGDAGKGWGVPVATDIAFAVGVLVLLGRRVPPGLKIFLLTLAVADDVGGIVVIALFYSTEVQPEYLLLAAAAFAAVVGMRFAGLGHPLAYVPAALVAWYAFVEAGVEPAIAGVILGLLTPALPVNGRDVLVTLEHRVGPWSAFAIVPVFAVANAGVELSGEVLSEAFGHSVAWGILLGLVVGKTVGITGATLLAVRLGVGRLGAGIRTVHVVGVAMLGGVGFTVALFVASLAFEDAPLLLEQAKIGVFVGSAIAAGLAPGTLMLAARRSPPPVPLDADAPVDADGNGWLDPDEIEQSLLAAVDGVESHMPHMPHMPHRRERRERPHDDA